MGVEVIGIPGETNGYGDSMDAFRASHENNSRILVNLAAGRKKNDPAPPYDPDHSDNVWPRMLYHPEHGDKTVGTSLKGLPPAVRQQVEKENKSAAKGMLDAGWRVEPYIKPQIAVLDPASEKAAMVAKNRELEGQIVAQGDRLAKLQESIDQLLKGKQE